MSDSMYGNPAGQKPKCWSKSGSLATGNTTKTVTMQQAFDDIGNFTVQFNVGNNPASNLPIRCEALITWSAAGNHIQRRITVSNGSTISGVAEHVHVRLMDVTSNDEIPDAGGITPNGAEYEVTVSVAPGTRAPTSQGPILVVNTFKLAHGTNKFVELPDDAGATSVTIIQNPSLPGSLTATSLVKQESNGIPFQSYDPQQYPTLPLLPGVNVLQVFNTSAGDTIAYSIILGIDG